MKINRKERKSEEENENTILLCKGAIMLSKGNNSNSECKQKQQILKTSP